MKKYKRFLLLLIFPLISLSYINTLGAEIKSFDGSGSLKVIPNDKPEVVDPEDPDIIVDPITPIPVVRQDFRIDYISPLDFGKVKLVSTNRVYSSLATQIGNHYRGNFIQISDFREKQSGWTLQVKQEYQFRTNENEELLGAVLSLDKGWASSIIETNEPTVTRDTLAITEFGQLYNVAKASQKTGRGTWSIVFGASKENEDNQDVTIESENSLDNKVSQKNIMKNSAIKISIPDTTKVLPKEYQTKISWVLSEVP